MESIRIVMYLVYLFILKYYKLRTIVNVYFTELTNVLKCITIKLQYLCNTCCDWLIRNSIYFLCNDHCCPNKLFPT